MTREWAWHSGSRWEPGPAAAVEPPNQISVTEDQSPRRRRRGPVLAVLVALLAIGGGSVGIAELSNGTGTVGQHSDGTGWGQGEDHPHHGQDRSDARNRFSS